MTAHWLKISIYSIASLVKATEHTDSVLQNRDIVIIMKMPKQSKSSVAIKYFKTILKCILHPFTVTFQLFFVLFFVYNVQHLYQYGEQNDYMEKTEISNR